MSTRSSYDWTIYSTAYSMTDFLIGYSTAGYFELNCGWGIAKGCWGDYN
ncbi:MAG: hypothetical protein LBF88_13230 [Planctomycetaceae bacterium]|nr:hypothetical protein [Planctomycetaceae bacterium]